MQMISGAVGAGAANNASDVALVKAMLLTAIVPPRVQGHYLKSYDGLYAEATAAAIKAFQKDVGLVGTMAEPMIGQVRPGDATWAALCSARATLFADLRVLPGGRTVYLEATGDELQAKVKEVNGKVFTAEFRTKVIHALQTMHADTGIAIGVCPQGDRRDFAGQYKVYLDKTSKAGPGESNHNYGMAVDLGFNGLRLLAPDGRVVTCDPWLHALDKSASEQALFFKAMQAAAIAAGGFRGPSWDNPHIQNWADAGVSMTARLAAHLARSGTMRWGRAGGVYTCDLGLGGALTPVGTAAQIWDGKATLTPVTLTALRSAAARRQTVPGQHPVPPATPSDADAMRRLLKQQFDQADANWRAWTPN